MKRSLLAIALLALTGAAFSQAPPPIEPLPPEPKPTACGVGGIGINGKTKLPEARDATPGKRVGDDLYWSNCTMPPDCPEIKPLTWGAGRCTSTSGVPAAYVGKTAQRSIQSPSGRIYLRCTRIDGSQAVWVITSTPTASTYCK